MSNWLLRIVGYLSKSRGVKVMTRRRACRTCEKPLAFTRPDQPWWQEQFCSNECGHKGIDADIEADRRLDDAMDATHDRFEDMD